MAKKKRRIAWRIVQIGAAIMVILMVAGVVVVASRHRVTVATDTTYLTGPLRPDGSVDYVEALEAEQSAGVTRENNAAVLLVKALGEEMVPSRDRASILREIGAEGFDAGRNTLDAAEREKIADVESERGALERLNRVRDVLDENAGPLGVMSAASRRARYYVPWPTPAPGEAMSMVLMPEAGALRSAGSALAARAGVRALDGDLAGAAEDLATLHRLGHLLRTRPVLFEQLMGMGMEAAASRMAREIVGQVALTAEQARVLLAEESAAAGAYKSYMKDAMRTERLATLDLIGLVMSGKLGGGGSGGSSPKVMILATADGLMRETNGWFDRMDAALDERDWVVRRRELDKIDANVEEMNKHVVWNVLTGRMLLAFPLSALAKAPVVEQRMEMDLELSAVAAALAAYKAEHGEYPETLAALAPGYLSKVPQDAFIGKPLHYAQRGDGYQLYSVGMDMKDNDGKADAPYGKEKDMVVEVGAAAITQKAGPADGE